MNGDPSMAKIKTTDMTLCNERYASVNATRMFLIHLLNPKVTPKVPTKIREEARRLLKHYPDEVVMETVAKQVPTLFGKDWRDQYK
jgi:hypothetical protein